MSAGGSQSVDTGDLWVAQNCEELRFPLEAGDALGISGERSARVRTVDAHVSLFTESFQISEIATTAGSSLVGYELLAADEIDRYATIGPSNGPGPSFFPRDT